MGNGRYQTILRQNSTIAFEYDPVTGEHFVSPFISEILAGDYDGCLLIEGLVEAAHPDGRDRLCRQAEYDDLTGIYHRAAYADSSV